jgi:hypothetical protein
MSTTACAASKPKKVDAFNWPALNRADTMTLKSLDRIKDFTHTKTIAHRSRDRKTSVNLTTADVDGRFVDLLN